MQVGEIRQFCKLPNEGQSLMQAAMTQFNLLARANHRILKLARTIADLAGCEGMQFVHLAKALQYRPKLMMSQGLGRPSVTFRRSLRETQVERAAFNNERWRCLAHSHTFVLNTLLTKQTAYSTLQSK